MTDSETATSTSALSEPIPEGGKPQLVIMAAGLGSRFGGVKQLARVGPMGEAFLDFAIKEARAAGFGQVVMIVRSDIEADVVEHIRDQHGDLPVVYVRQDDLGPPRDKPWGTLHAILSAADVIDRPFTVLNADDYYGPRSYRLAAECIDGIEPGRAANVAFEMGNTVPPRGAVTRAVCQVHDGTLTDIVETEGCQRNGDGTYSARGRRVTADTLVSMNLWCFHHSVLEDLAERWEVFLAANADDAKAEAQLPTIVGQLMADDRLTVDVVSSPERWIGITNPDDYELAKETFAQYHI